MLSVWCVEARERAAKLDIGRLAYSRAASGRDACLSPPLVSLDRHLLVLLIDNTVVVIRTVIWPSPRRKAFTWGTSSE